MVDTKNSEMNDISVEISSASLCLHEHVIELNVTAPLTNYEELESTTAISMTADCESMSRHHVDEGLPSFVPALDASELGIAGKISNNSSNRESSPVSTFEISISQPGNAASSVTSSDGTGKVCASDSIPDQMPVEAVLISMEETDMQMRSPSSGSPSDCVNLGHFYRSLVDTAAPFESVKEAVSKFGGIVDWKAHKLQALERRKCIEQELEKTREEIPEHRRQLTAVNSMIIQLLDELDTTMRCIEDLNVKLEKVLNEENLAKQDFELACLRVQEIDQGITSEASVAAQTQLEVAKNRYAAAAAELQYVRIELGTLEDQLCSLTEERETSVRRAEAAVSSSLKSEETVEELTEALVMAKESLELAQTTHMEAEEQRIAAVMAKEQDEFIWERELNDAEDSLLRLNEQRAFAKELGLKLVSESQRLANLKAKFSAYMGTQVTQEAEVQLQANNSGIEFEEKERSRSSVQAVIASAKLDHAEVQAEIEKAKGMVNCLSAEAASLLSELEREKTALISLRQREGIASVTVVSLEAELGSTMSEVEIVCSKEVAVKKRVADLPRTLQQNMQDTEHAKLAAKLAQDEHRRAKEEAEQAKAGLSTTETRLHAALKEAEAARASEKLALAAIKALEGHEAAANADSASGVTLSMEQYNMLSKRAHDAEEEANVRVASALAGVEVVKESESRCQKNLQDAIKEMNERKEALQMAVEKAESAKAGKLHIEQELRKWRADHQQRRRASDAGPLAVNPIRSPECKGFEENRKPGQNASGKSDALTPDCEASNKMVYISGNDKVVDTGSRLKIKKKRSFLPMIVMFLVRRKSHKK